MTPGPASLAIALTPWAILTATAGLVAFHIGLYTLIARERKSPYVINRLFPIFLLSLVVAVVSTVSVLVPVEYQESVLRAASAILVGTFMYSLVTVYGVAIRFIFFVDTMSFKHLLWVRAVRRAWKNIRGAHTTYEHDPVQLSSELKAEVLRVLSEYDDKTFEEHEGLDKESVVATIRDHGQSNLLSAKLAQIFLKKEYTVQYLAASRHPFDFIIYLKQCLESDGGDWPSSARRIVVIDAYTRHFGFIDSVYPKKRRDLEALGIKCVNSTMTFAGMHSASSKAFNLIKAQDQVNTPRKPTLVIYEGTHALADLESAEQYRIFVRHVMPSERAWGGMFTVFIEAALPEGDWTLLRSYASMSLDLRGPK